MTTSKRYRPLPQIVLSRLRTFYREPGAVFWVYGFPLLMIIALGIAFRTTPAQQLTVDVEAGPDAAAIRDALTAASGSGAEASRSRRRSTTRNRARSGSALAERTWS